MDPTRDTVPAQAPRFSDFFREHREEILEDWAHGVRVDHRLELLDELADLADALVEPGRHERADALSARHAHQRMADGLELAEVVTEYSELRDCLLRLWMSERHHSPFDVVGLRALNRAIDSAIAAAVEAERTAPAEAERALAMEDALLSNSLVGFGFIDRDLRYVRINEALAAMNGHTPNAHLGRTVREMLGDLADFAEPLLRRVMDTGESLANLEVTLALPGAPDEMRSFLANYFPVRISSGEIIGVGVTAVEITDRARAKEALERALKAREEILAVVSHDLRNPLGAIYLAAATLAQDASREPRSRRQAEAILRSAHRMDHLIGDLLDTASIEGGRLAVEKQPVNLEALVNEAIETHEASARHKDLKIERAADFEGRRAFCDRDRILQVFGNLLGNAIKFCRAGDAITLGGSVEGDEAQISVSDTGPGIAEVELPRVFQPYWSGEHHAKKGTGLGLYIAQGIIQVHGGRMWVESKAGAGTTFTFTLPLVAEPLVH